MQKKIRMIKGEPLLLLALPFSLISLLLILILRPLVKVRIGFIRSDRIGHFAANTELYLCWRDDQKQKNNYKTVDLFYFTRKVCNQQLARMLKRELVVLPWFWLRPIDLVIRSFSSLSFLHAFETRGGDRDIDNLYDKIPPHLQFNTQEEARGAMGLRSMGIPVNAKFVCLTVRDCAYLNSIYPDADTSYQNYRDSDIQKYVLAAEALADYGYFVIRMGAKVHSSIKSTNSRVIDYATNGMRSDFMDIYLGAKCTFVITVGTGFDAVPVVFRRPLVQVNAVPLGICYTWGNSPLLLTKHHIDIASGHELTLSQIFSRDVGFSTNTSDYQSKGIELIENTPEEIRDVVIEMAERIAGTFKGHQNDDALQKRFWEIFPVDKLAANGVPIHGKIHARYSAAILRNNPDWLS